MGTRQEHGVALTFHAHSAKHPVLGLFLVMDKPCHLTLDLLLLLLHLGQAFAKLLREAAGTLGC